jgi:hypothetical protein
MADVLDYGGLDLQQHALSIAGYAARGECPLVAGERVPVGFVVSKSASRVRIYGLASVVSKKLNLIM